MIAAAIFAVPLLYCLRIGTDAVAAAAPAKPRPISQRSNFYIYDPTGTQLLGRARYLVTQRGSVVTIDGHNEFIDGQRDVEHDTLKSVDGEIPRMLSYQHDFFDSHGAALLSASADAASGKTSCAKYENGKGTIETAVLQFPEDTYAGASVLVAVADQLRRGGIDLDIHVFDCALGPRILTLHADLERGPWSFRPHDGDLAKAEAHPVFGWFNVFLKPFVPTIRMWFDPLRDYAFVGGTLSRYFRGPEVLLVSMSPAVKPEPAFERPEPPAFTAPSDSATPAPPPSASAASAALPSRAVARTPEQSGSYPAKTTGAR
jgi:hypothetical protein